jgi:hypothetical protein
MAIAVANSVKGNTATLTITSATKGNILAVFIVQSASVLAPTIKDNIDKVGTKWTVNATKSVFTASADSIWFATKEAEGAEVTIEPTAGVGGTIQGMDCWELSGAKQTVDKIVTKDNIAAAKTATSAAITTANAGDIILACAGGKVLSETITAWTGTKVLNNIATTTAMGIGGSLVLTATISAETFTANWTKSRASGLLVVALEPSAAETLTAQCKAVATLKDKASLEAQEQAQINASGPGGVKGIVTLRDKATAQEVSAGKAVSAVTIKDTLNAQMIAQAKAQAKEQFQTQVSSQQTITAGVVAQYRFKDGATIEVVSKVQALSKLIFQDVATPQAMMQAGARAKVIITASAAGKQEQEGVTATAQGVSAFRFATAASPQQISQVAGKARLVFAGNATVAMTQGEGGGTKKVALFIFED